MIIGISGKIGSGKDTVGKYLKTKYNFKIETLALNVRKIVSILTGIPLDILLTREAKGIIVKYNNKELRVGELFQIVGNGLRDSIHPDVWVNSLFANITGNVVITDVRYPNEVLEIEKQGGIVIRVEGDPQNIRLNIKNGKSEDKRDLNAISETALDNWQFKYKLENDTSLDELFKKVDDIIYHNQGIDSAGSGAVISDKLPG
jgi:dephospho-CoA kinase